MTVPQAVFFFVKIFYLFFINSTKYFWLIVVGCKISASSDKEFLLKSLLRDINRTGIYRSMKDFNSLLLERHVRLS